MFARQDESCFCNKIIKMCKNRWSETSVMTDHYKKIQLEGRRLSVSANESLVTLSETI